MRLLYTRPASEPPLPHCFDASAAGKRLPMHSSTVQEGLVQQISPSELRFEGQRKPHTCTSSVVSTYIVQSLPTARPTAPVPEATQVQRRVPLACKWAR